MPVYEYVCKACREGFESYQRRMDAPKPKCPQCGKRGRVERAIAGYAFIKDEATKLRELHPKYAKMVDAAWDKSAKSDPLSKTPFKRLVDSGKRLEDLW
ncbi:MAG: zinc ribbon domain-containing protein [Dehalococcoidia bacterium]